MRTDEATGSKYLLDKTALALIFTKLTDEGFRVVGPKVMHDAIQLADITSVDELPWGVTQHSTAGRVNLSEGPEDRAFTWNTNLHSIKPWLFEPEETLWRATPSDDGFVFKLESKDVKPLAIIGVRACDIAGLALLDAHFGKGTFADPNYLRRREGMMIIAVNCSDAQTTCFCASTGDGPTVNHGADLVIDEIDSGFLISVGSEEGNNLLTGITLTQASPIDLRLAQNNHTQATNNQPRKLPAEQALLSLLDNLDDTHWQEIEQRCLACGNCTSACPTCFCSRQESHGTLAAVEYSQQRYWDSCFSEQHAHIAGKNMRPKIYQRYRQWLVHKFATWQQQYQRSGCVGCGRCIAWCPVGIDVVEEVNRRVSDQ